MEFNLEASEDEEQIALMDWSKFNPICREYLIHIPNQRMCSIQYGKKLQRMGVKSGVSDLFLAYPKFYKNEIKGGLWIELKKRRGIGPTLMQSRWINLMTQRGYKAVVCFGWEEAKNAIEDYLK